MHFLNPAILFGLLAVSIPILIHLLNLRKVRKVEFSTLMFLKEIQKSKMRRIKLKQVYLLLLRIFSIVFLVLCFSSPVFEGYAGSGNESNTTALIFIDNSFSMSARDNNGMYLNQAKEAVKKILENHKESDEIHFIPTSWIGMKKKNTYYNSFKEISDSLDKINFSYKPEFIDEVISLSNTILSESKNSRKEIFIISDFQKNNFNREILGNEFKNFNDNSINTYLIKVGNREIRNLSLDSFVTVTKILEKDKDVKIKIYLTNHSEYNLKNKTINLYVDNELKAERVVDVNSYEKKEIEFIFKTSRSGSTNGVIELVQSEFQDDEILQDNKYYFTIYIPGHFEIGLIGDNPKDYSFIKLALETATNILSDSLSKKSELFKINYESSIPENISKNNIVFIANKNIFSDNEAQVLKEYISNGGGAFIFLGNDIDPNNYNATILNKLNSVRIEKLNNDKALNENLKFEKVDFENPLLSEIFSNQKLNITAEKFNIESPKINSYFELLPGENSNPVITLSNNKPFLIESNLSKGKVIISSVSASNDFSDFPVKSIFVPVIIRSIYYLSNNFEIQKQYIAGNSNLIAIRDIKNISEIELPNKSSVKPEIKFENESENFLYLPYNDNSSQTGIYTLQDSAGAENSFSMNYNPSESNPLTMSKIELTEYFKKNNLNNVRIIESEENISESIKESKTGLSLWKYFLIGALLFLAGELLLSKSLEKS